MGVINFNGVSTNSKRFSAPILVETPPDYAFPSRDANFTHVPGRDGDVLVDNGSYNNVTRTYNLAIGDEDIDFARLAYELSDWLHSANGYAKLTDSYDSEHYCMAAFVDEGSIVNILQHAGRISVSFNCKPQRYLISGDDKITLSTSGSTIYNPTAFNAKPLLYLGAGQNEITTFTIETWMYTDRDHENGTMLETQTIIVDNSNIYKQGVYVDCELMDCYDFVTNEQQVTVVRNRNNDITFSNNKFPILCPGKTRIKWTNPVGFVEVIPRWWTI